VCGIYKGKEYLYKKVKHPSLIIIPSSKTLCLSDLQIINLNSIFVIYVLLSVLSFRRNQNLFASLSCAFKFSHFKKCADLSSLLQNICEV
jgi:hypothetical protein